ncbi:hypothetical protein [uncultured Maricaulis sp.]|uniref:hypothetical protein n=1 Tax=uncultured Maricaulis sp. TaxID=174710 RepID=UPI0030D6F596|tara:strand:+ start:1294 stop:2040 length:747 start_codon:yes stop_codon:yes gene_type:complete
MTQTGDPSLISDIRYFLGGQNSYLRDFELDAFGRRLAFWLNTEGISLGAYHSLYLLFSPSVNAGDVVYSDIAAFWWHRYVSVGVPRQFPNIPDALSLGRTRTCEALCALCPQDKERIEAACRYVEAVGDSIRFTVLESKLKDSILRAAVTIGVFPEPSHLHVSIEDRSSGIVLESLPVPIGFYDRVFDLAGRIRREGDEIILEARTSFSGSSAAAESGWPLRSAVAEFSPLPTGAVCSSRVRRFGKAK